MLKYSFFSSRTVVVSFSITKVSILGFEFEDPNITVLEKNDDIDCEVD